MHKKIVIVGSGTAGLISAVMMRNYWRGKVDISLYHDSTDKTIAVGESTTPIIGLLLQHLGITTTKFLEEFKDNATIKLGINFKNWIPNKEFFHGFIQVGLNSSDSTGVYTIPRGSFNSGILYSRPTTFIPDLPFEEFTHALHIDTEEFIKYLTKKLQKHITFVDDRIEKVEVEGDNIKSITGKATGKVEADLFVDATGFSALLLKHLNPKWNDVSDILPLNRAIPQQVPNTTKTLPSYTLSEATKNGWIWRLPIAKRFGTGYIYSSKFTSDEEARVDYNDWLIKNYNIGLQTNRTIHYKPGYYEDHWIGNCIAVGLSSGFVEPLESTAIQTIIQQVQEFIDINSTLKGLAYSKRLVNKANRKLYTDVVNFICLHYNTNRTDSEFWRYMTTNKIDWVRELDEKCKKEFLDRRTSYAEMDTWHLDSFVAIANGLNMFTDEGIYDFSIAKPYNIEGATKREYQKIEEAKAMMPAIPHNKVIEFYS